MKRLGYFLLILVSCHTIGPSASGDLLTPGDIAIIGINSASTSDPTDDFAWFPLVNLPAGKEIFFTDNGWKSNNTFLGGEGAIKFTTPIGGISAGTIQLADLSAGLPLNYSAVNDVIVGNSFELSLNGDQLFVFDGSISSPNFIFAVQTNSTVFQDDATNGNISAVPQGLSTLQNTAVAVGANAGPTDEFDNARYKGSVVSGDKVTLLAEIADRTNWEGLNSPARFLGAALHNNVPSFNVVLAPVVPEPQTFTIAAIALFVLAGLAFRKRCALR